MILLWGIPSESPLERVLVALKARRAPVFVFNQRQLLASVCDWRIDRGAATGWLEVGDARVPLEELDGIYVRAMDPEFVPEMRGATAAAQAAARAAHEALGI